MDSRQRVREIKRRTGYQTHVPGRKKIYIYKNVFDYLVKSQDGFLASSVDKPRVYFVGSNQHGVIMSLKKVANSAGGCWNMPRISTENMTDAAIEMAKRGYNVCGLARVGKFNIKKSGYLDGQVLQELTREHPEMLLLSFGLEGLRVSGVLVSNYKTTEVVHNYAVTSKREGGDSNGGKERGSKSSNQSDVREVVSSGGHSGTGEGDNTQRIPEPKAVRVQPVDQGEQRSEADGLRPEGQRHSNDGDQSERGSDSITPSTPSFSPRVDLDGFDQYIDGVREGRV